MLPYLKKQRVAGLIMAVRKPDGAVESEYESEEDHGLKECAKELIKAISEKNESAVAEALRAAFQILDSEPHVEGEHLDENDD